MKIEIEKFMYFGRYYKDISSKLNWWFCEDDYQIYSSEQLKSDFSYLDEDSILQSDLFIPVFQTDIIELEQIFLSTYNSKILQSKLEKHLIQTDGDFDKAFKILIEAEAGLSVSWYSFERETLCKDAVKWCQKHNIKYQ